MSEETKGMKPIWYFVGLLMLTIGVIIFCSGVYYALYPPQVSAELYGLHPDVWWGAIMTLFGVGLLWINKDKTIL